MLYVSRWAGDNNLMWQSSFFVYSRKTCKEGWSIDKHFSETVIFLKNGFIVCTGRLSRCLVSCPRLTTVPTGLCPTLYPSSSGLQTWGLNYTNFPVGNLGYGCSRGCAAHLYTFMTAHDDSKVGHGITWREQCHDTWQLASTSPGLDSCGNLLPYVTQQHRFCFLMYWWLSWLCCCPVYTLLLWWRGNRVSGWNTCPQFSRIFHLCVCVVRNYDHSLCGGVVVLKLMNNTHKQI